MRVHHLNCGTLCPPFGRLVQGKGSLLSRGHLVCHCVLVELDDALLLIDTGLGLADVERPRERLGATFPSIFRPLLDPKETAIRQIEALGFAASDVRHIVLTHLDLDHAGGLSDFPAAEVHVHRPVAVPDRVRQGLLQDAVDRELDRPRRLPRRHRVDRDARLDTRLAHLREQRLQIREGGLRTVALAVPQLGEQHPHVAQRTAGRLGDRAEGLGRHLGLHGRGVPGPVGLRDHDRVSASQRVLDYSAGYPPQAREPDEEHLPAI